MDSVNTLTVKAQNDLKLVEKAKQGDNKAFATLMNRYKDPIYYMLLKMVNNPYDAEDLTMEAFGKAFSNIHSYTPEYAFSTWLFMISTNNCIDFIRKRNNDIPLIDHTDDAVVESLVQAVQSELPDPEEAMINDQKFDTLHSLVTQLKSPYREIIELRYYKEYSYEEIAAELNIPVGTVKIWLFRAKRLLFTLFNTNEKR